MRSPVLPLTWHLTKSSGRRGLQSQLLAAGAAAVGSLVLLVLLAAYLGAGARSDRTTWRIPDPVPAKDATAVQVLSTSYVRGKPVTIVSLAQLPDREPTPAPPGLTTFPKQDEVYVSPALAELLHRLPARQLADRFPKTASYGTIGAAGLASPDELVAVVGRAPADPEVTEAVGGTDFSDGAQTTHAVISGFSGSRPSLYTDGDQDIMLMGVGLVVVPVTVLASAAGRLGAARREQRLAALRLAGATPRQILAMTGVEAVVVGAVGALVGAVAYCVLLPALAQVPYGIGTWYTGQLWVGLGRLVAVVLAVAALIGISAVMTLRQVATSPLGVAQQSDPRRTRWIRVALFVAALVYLRASMGDGSLTGSKVLASLLLFYCAFWLFGPWVVDRLGRIAGRFARRPATLLAARRLSDDPRGAWRTVSGLVLAGFVAGFFTVGHLGVIGFDYHNQIAVPTASGADSRHAASDARTLLREAGVTATVGTGGENLILQPGQGVTVQVTGGPEQVDTALTVLQPLSSGQLPYTQDYVNADGDMYTARLADLGTILLMVSFFVATASAGLTAAANVLDRRRMYGLLRLAGTPLKVLDKARVRETVLPLVVLAGGTTATGIYAAHQFNKAAGGTISASGAVQLAVSATIGALAMFAAIGASRPLLRKVTADPAQTAD